MKWHDSITFALLLEIIVLCLLGQALNRYCDIFREFEPAVLSLQWMLLVFIAVWCGSFLFLTFNRKDLPLIGLLLIAIAMYFIREVASSRAVGALILLAGVTLGRGARFTLNEEVRKKNAEVENVSTLVTRHPSLATFLVGFVGLVAFASWWHLEPMDAYRGPRWMGLWDNPNIYGMLMGAGLTLAIGLLAEMKNAECRMQNSGEKRKVESGKRKLLFAAILLVAVGMMAVGLFFSYSRGAWVGTAVGLLYLAKAHGKFKWRCVLPVILVVAAVICFFWHSTADTDQWYLQRLDLSRPSAQHRVSAWRGAVQMMWDHPLGVGWNNAVSVYDKNYSPPEGGAAALTMNSYLMLGTELGLPGLLCFVGYVALCFRTKQRHLTPSLSPFDHSAPVKRGEGETSVVAQQSTPLVTCHSSLPTVCRAGAAVLLVAFWFDGGLFDLPTAAVFWVLLELGSARAGKEDGWLKIDNDLKAA